MPHSAVTGALAVEGLVKAFGGAPVLDGVRLRVPSGKVVALLGPSGCGKTTLLRCIAGLERPDAGEVRLAGRLLCGPGELVPPERRRNGRVEEALALVDLAGFGARAPASLSGGQQQRVALARALVTHPTALLLDEPFSNLDTLLRVQIRAEVQRLLADLGVTAVFVTHDQEEAFVVGDEVAVMLGGRIVQQTTPAELYRAPASRAVAGLLGDLHGDVDVLLRPEQLRVAAGRQATVDAVEYYGHDAVYLTRLPDGAAVRVRVLDAPEFRPGDRVDLDYVGGPTVGYPRASH